MLMNGIQYVQGNSLEKLYITDIFVSTDMTENYRSMFNSKQK